MDNDSKQPDASCIGSSDLLALVARWRIESDEYDQIRRSPANESRATSRALQMGRSEAYSWCADELDKILSANLADEHTHHTHKP